MCSNCPSQNCSLGDYGGYCIQEIHVDQVSKMPQYIEQKCLVHDGPFIIDECRVSHVTEFGDLYQGCCEDPFCNECPLDVLLDEIKSEYLDLLYTFFPEYCNKTRRTFSTTSSTGPVVPSQSVSLPSRSNQSTTVLITDSGTNTPTTSASTTPGQLSTSMETYVIVFAIMASLGLLVIISVIVVTALVISFIRRGKRRKVTETPYATNEAFLDFNGESQSCSSNALTETRLLQTRTLVDDVKFTRKLGRGRFGSVFLGMLLCYML